MINNDLPNARDAFIASTSQMRPHLARQIDQLAENPEMQAFQVDGAESLNQADRRFLTKFRRILNSL